MSVRWRREKQQRFRSRCRWWKSEFVPASGQFFPLWTNPVFRTRDTQIYSTVNTRCATTGFCTGLSFLMLLTGNFSLLNSLCTWIFLSINPTYTNKHQPAVLQRMWDGCSCRSCPPLWRWRESSRRSSSLLHHLNKRNTANGNIDTRDNFGC